MVEQKIRAAFSKLREARPTKWVHELVLTPEASSWILQAQALILSTLGRSHPVTKTFEQAADVLLKQIAFGDAFRVVLSRPKVIEGAFDAATAIVDSDQLLGLVDVARAETEVELVETARHLLAGNHLLAAAVLCGGALETRLRRFCDRHGIAWQGEGSIGAYNDALAAARKADPMLPIFNAATSDLVRAWGKIRNDAAHTPLEFMQQDLGRQHRAVAAMIDGVAGMRASYP